MILEMRDICKDYPMGKSVAHILKNVNLDVEEGEYLAIMGSLRQRQDHADEPDRVSGRAHQRQLSAGRTGRDHLQQQAAGGGAEQGAGLRVPELQPAAEADGSGERGAAPAVRRGEEGGTAGTGPGRAGDSGAFRPVDHRPDQLSGGQCQRVAIARAIVGKPKLLLADEPTGALDSASGAAVMELFQQLHDSGSTIIMITHDHSIANHAAKVMTIRDGVLSGGDDYE